jgi:hypothetical protein
MIGSAQHVPHLQRAVVLTHVHDHVTFALEHSESNETKNSKRGDTYVYGRPEHSTPTPFLFLHTLSLQ